MLKQSFLQFDTVFFKPCDLFSINWLPREAPIEWLVKMHQRPQILLWLFTAIGFVLLSAIAFVSGHYVVAVIVLACSGFTVCGWYLLSFKGLPTDVMENFTLVLYLVVAGSFTWVPLSVADPVYRHRSMGMNLLVWRAVLPYSGLRIRPSVVFLIVTACNEAMATYAIAGRYGEVVPIRVFIVLFVIAVLFLAPVCHEQMRWRKLYETEQQVVIEKEATDSLLSMICDATFWVAADGNHVLRSDCKLDSIIGCSMQGAHLLDFVPLSERDRYTDAFASEAEAEQRPVMLLPITLVCKDAMLSCKVELFINDRRHAFAVGASASSMQMVSSSQQLGFLVGVRLIDQGVQEPNHSNPAPDALDSTEDTGISLADTGRGNFAASLGAPLTSLRRARQNSEIDGASTFSSSSLTSGHTKSILKKSYVPEKAKDLETPVGAPAQCSGAYMLQCTERLLIDLVSTWNFRYHGCCHWHAGVSKLEAIVQKLQSTYRCSDKWSPSNIKWQCGNCSGLMTADDSDCWICYLMGVESQANDASVKFEIPSAAEQRHNHTGQQDADAETGTEGLRKRQA